MKSQYRRTMTDTFPWASLLNGGIGAGAAIAGALINQLVTNRREAKNAKTSRAHELEDELRDRGMLAAEKALESTLELLDTWHTETPDDQGRFDDLHESTLRRISTRAAIISDQRVRHGVYYGITGIEGVSARYAIGDIEKDSPAQECRWIAGHIRDVLGAYLREHNESIDNHYARLTEYRDRAVSAMKEITQV